MSIALIATTALMTFSGIRKRSLPDKQSSLNEECEIIIPCIGLDRFKERLTGKALRKHHYHIINNI